MFIKGVNLGNWLVLEKWMSPALFQGSDAEHEYYLQPRLSKEVYEARIRIHRSEYITERDFAQIRALGMNMVRIPVPYFVFGDCPPFLGCTEELDKAFAWAEKYGLQILLDLHTVPGSQNGFDNGGISGVCKWAQQPENVEFALSVLTRLAERYGKRSGLYGIQILNEPNTEASWEIFNVTERYRAVDPGMAEGSAPISFGFLKEFYREAYGRLREVLPEEKAVVFHDGFDIYQWKDFFETGDLKNVVLDTHQYLMMAEMDGCEQTVEGYVTYIHEHYEKAVEEVSRYVPVICGEWCLFNSLGCGHDTKGGQSVLNGVEGTSEESLSAVQKKEIYQAVCDAQLSAWRKGNGYFYWNYKLLTDTVNEPGWIGWDAWDLGRCAANGWFTEEGGK